MRSRIAAMVAATALALTMGASSEAGTISLAWDPVVGAAGYRVYYGTESEAYTNTIDVGNATEAVLDGLEDCTAYYASVKAYTPLGESATFSNEVSGWARPAIVTETTAALQGSQIVLDISGSNFDPSAELLIDTGSVPLDANGDPLVVFETVDVIGCDRIQALVTVEPTAMGFQSMQIGNLPVGLELRNPDGVFNTGLIRIDVEFNPDRADINRVQERSRDRIDGDDLASFARAWASSVGEDSFEFGCDMDGDTDIDGDDLALLATLFGHCRSGSGWSAEACL